MSQKRQVPPIIWTILFFLMLTLGVTSYAKAADTILIVVRLSFLIVFSVVVVRGWWSYQHRSQ